MLDIRENKYGPSSKNSNYVGRNKQILNNKSQIETDVVDEMSGLDSVYLIHSEKGFLNKWH